MAKIEKRRTRWQKLRLRYQFNLMNEETYEVKSVFSFSILNLMVWVFMIFLFVGALCFTVISFTPIRQYIPGYGKLNDRRQAILHQSMADSVSIWAAQVDQKMRILEQVLSGDIDTTLPDETSFSPMEDSLYIYSRSREDSLLRAEVEQRERFSIFESEEELAVESLSDLYFFPPLKGVVSDTFNAAKGHFGVDIIGSQSKDVKAVLDGRVILSEYTIETGYVIAIQHGGDLLSIYKHNSEVNRKVGNLVQQGEVIAVSGNTGELTSGPHLHFELWYQGEPLNPTRFVPFE